MDIHSDQDAFIHSLELRKSVGAAVGKVTELAEKAARFRTYVEVLRVLTECSKETTMDYIVDKIREDMELGKEAGHGSHG